VTTATDAPVVALEKAPVVAVTGTGEEVPVAEITNLPLPHTASSVPLIALVGLLAIAAAFGLAILAKRTV
jgi:LPXTG-motif cell wall-anchored protein